MLPASRNLSIYAGDDYDLPVRLRNKTVDGQAGDPIDLTGCTATSQIRATVGSGTVLATFDCTIPGEPDTGIIIMSLTHTQTATLVNGFYDLQVTFVDGKVKTFLKGSVTVTPEVTHV